MADDPDDFKPGEASDTVVSLSQVLLAPLDALFKAQVHAARSFLSFLLQVGYGDKPERRDWEAQTPNSKTPPAEPDTIYTMNFVQEVPGPVGTDGTTHGSLLQKVSIPTLALVPLRPLAIDSAEVELAMEVTWIDKHRQMRPSVRGEDDKTPGWFLVDDPISLRGHVASPESTGPTPSKDAPAEGGVSDKRLIHIKVSVATVPTPSGLERLLTTLTQSSSVQNHDKPTT